VNTGLYKYFHHEIVFGIPFAVDINMKTIKVKHIFKEIGDAQAWLEDHKSLNPSTTLKIYPLVRHYEINGDCVFGGYAISTKPFITCADRWNRQGIIKF
jgi:hypothetical protein